MKVNGGRRTADGEEATLSSLRGSAVGRWSIKEAVGSLARHLPLGCASARTVRILALCLLLILAAPHAIANEPSAGVQWQALSADQKKILQRHESRWERLPPERQEAMAQRAQRWASMSPEERDEARKRMEQWRSLDPEQRRELRRRHEEFKALPEEEQARIREHFKRFQALPPEKRRELREKFHRLPPEERKRMMDELREGKR